jgi:hypothetical protein
MLVQRDGLVGVRTNMFLILLNSVISVNFLLFFLLTIPVSIQLWTNRWDDIFLLEGLVNNKFSSTLHFLHLTRGFLERLRRIIETGMVKRKNNRKLTEITLFRRIKNIFVKKHSILALSSNRRCSIDISEFNCTNLFCRITISKFERKVCVSCDKRISNVRWKRFKMQFNAQL